MRWDQSTAPNIVRIVNPKVVEADDEVLIAQQDNSTPVPARKKIGGPEAALDHYMSGSGDAVEFPFDLIDTSTVEPSQVPRRSLHNSEGYCLGESSPSPYLAGSQSPPRANTAEGWLGPTFNTLL